MKGSVYVIRSFQTEDVYYGSTTQMLCRRMAKHRSNFKIWLNSKICYCSSYDILKHGDAYIELVEEVEFQNKKELHAREGFYIRNNECVNKVVPDRTREEYYNSIDYIEHKKQYREANKEVAKVKRNQPDIKEQRRQYREANKDKINAYKREAYLKKKAES